MNSCAVCDIRSPSNGITISSSTPSAAIRSAFCSSVVRSLGADAGETTVRGCGSKVSTLSAPRDDLAVAGVHAVELAHRQAARPGLRVREPGDVHQPRKPTTGLSVAPPRGSASAIRPSASRSRTMPLARPGTVDAVRGLARRFGVQVDDGQERERVVEPDQALLVGVGDVEVADVRPPQLDAVRVAQVHDQRAHVGARGALDRERDALAVAPQRVEARHGRPRARAPRQPDRRGPARTRACRRS